jgi:hypothetical protein
MQAHVPLLWSDINKYLFTVTLDSPIVHYVGLHVPMINALLTEMTGVALETDHDDFCPTTYQFAVSAVNANMLWVVNEYNCVTISKGFELMDTTLDVNQRDWENAYFNFTGKELAVDFSIDSTIFEPSETTSRFVIQAKTLSLPLVLPDWNTTHLYCASQRENCPVIDSFRMVMEFASVVGKPADANTKADLGR